MAPQQQLKINQDLENSLQEMRQSETDKDSMVDYVKEKLLESQTSIKSSSFDEASKLALKYGHAVKGKEIGQLRAQRGKQLLQVHSELMNRQAIKQKSRQN